MIVGHTVHTSRPPSVEDLVWMSYAAIVRRGYRLGLLSTVDKCVVASCGVFVCVFKGTVVQSGAVVLW